jgi:hypothetical protein
VNENNSFTPGFMKAIGSTCWVIAEGYIPGESTGPAPQMLSHETACILNTSEDTAEVEITLFYSDREPAGPYKISIPPRRTRHIRFNDLQEPEPVPRNTDYSSVIVSTLPVVVQYTRLDSRQAANALMTTLAYPVY